MSNPLATKGPTAQPSEAQPEAAAVESAGSTAVLDAPVAYEPLTLPRAKERRHNFYCVFLDNPKNERGETGPYAVCVIEDALTELVADLEHPVKPFNPNDYPNDQARKRARNFPKAIVQVDDHGQAIRQPRRAYRYIAQGLKHMEFYEDPRAVKAKRTATGIAFPVQRVHLYCPVLGVNNLGDREDHGPYIGVDEVVHGLGPRQKEGGVCPKCRTPEMRDKAAEKIRDIIRKVAPETLVEA